jgi:hypothetical protein
LHTLRTFTYVHPKNTVPWRDPHSASSKSDILESGTTVASLFFENVFGAQAQKALSVFVALRCVLRSLLRVYQIIFMGRMTVHWGERHWVLIHFCPIERHVMTNLDRVSIYSTTFKSPLMATAERPQHRRFHKFYVIWS